VWTLLANLAAWTSSFMTTSTPRPECGPGTDLDRGEQVGRPVGPGAQWIAHGTGEDDRLVARPQQIERVRSLLERVGALGHDNGIAAPLHQAGQPVVQQGDVGELEVTRWLRHEALRLDDGHLGELGNRADQVGGLEPGADARTSAC